MKKLYRSVLNAVEEAEKIANEKKTEKEKTQAEEILAQMKEIALSIRHNDEKYEVLNNKMKEMENNHRYEEEIKLLHERLEDKDRLLSSQQDMLQQANAALVKLRKEAEKNEKESSILRETVERLEKEMKEKEKMPMHYAVKMQAGENVPPILAYFDTTEPRSTGTASIFAKLKWKKKSRQDIVKMVVGGNLDTQQLIQIRTAIERGLSETQLLNLIHSGAGAEQMKEIIEIAVLENSMQ